MTPVHRVVIVSDVHFPEHHKEAWAAAKEVIARVEPELLIMNGDIIDLAQMSTYAPEKDQEPLVINEIKMAIRETMSAAKHCGGVVFVPGNHEDRYGKHVFGAKADKLRGLKGLSLREQFYAQGLPQHYGWISENKDVPGWVHEASRTVVRHGHKQGSKYGCVNIANKLARENPGVNLVVGHHHRVQMHTQTVFGRTYFSVANGHLSANHEYSCSPDWQRGMTVLSFYGHKQLSLCPRVSAQVVLADKDGGMVYDGKYFSGKAT